MLPKHIETLIVGGGQAGLAMSHMLSRRSCPHLVVERARIAERWRSERWDGLRFQFPNWSVGLPIFRFLIRMPTDLLPVPPSSTTSKHTPNELSHRFIAASLSADCTGTRMEMAIPRRPLQVRSVPEMW